MRKLLYIIASVFLLITLSCSKDDIDVVDVESLEGVWVLDSIVNPDSPLGFSIPTANPPILSFFGNNSVGVTAPCNSGQGTWQIADGEILITDLALTEMACDYLDFEYIYVNNLSGKYTIDELTLKIESNDGYVLYFDKAAELD